MTAVWEIREGDCREVLASLPAESVNTVVTSPPYFGLRDYGTGEWEGGDPACEHRGGNPRPDHSGGRGVLLDTRGTQPSAAATATPMRDVCTRCGARGVDRQIGLEPTPDEFVDALVQVFREVRRVLRDDGTVWLNLGDSYADRANRRTDGESFRADRADVVPPKRNVLGDGLKAKDLIGIPWMVAKALQAPYYTGSIRDERDRIWLAAMLDAEGCIYVHRRPKGQENGNGYARRADSFGPGIEIANTSAAIVERCREITGMGSILRHDKARRRPLYRWTVRTRECRQLLRELYPHLVAKQHEARVAFGCPSSGEMATAAWEALKLLHRGSETTVDFNAPPSLYEPGWYLRSDVVWAKPNPMPESVRDRPTRSHEFIFLLSKGPRYFYDADAIREPHADASLQRYEYGLRSEYAKHASEINPTHGGDSAIHNADRMGDFINYAGRNKRDVWTVSTKPYAGAHFATFPPDLIEPCVLAGAPHGGMVLDPFAGAGTTGLVAVRNGRRFVGVELNPEYAAMARDRIATDVRLGHRPPRREQPVEAQPSLLDVLEEPAA